jgi:hypothetical protein
VRPALKSGLLPVWRDRDTVQIGIDPRRAVALTGVGQAAWVIGLLDGSRDRAQVIDAAVGRGIPAQMVERILAILAAAGALDDFPASTLRALSQPVRAALAAELATVSLASRDGDGGARVLARRRAARVRIYGADGSAAHGSGTHGSGTDGSGASRIGTAIADILTTSGVGMFASAEPRATGRRADAQPAAAVRATGTAGRARLPGVTQAVQPDLAVLTGYQQPELAMSLVRDRVAHLAASAGEAIGTVGPLVVPGQTSCLRCLDFTRTDHDPAWPLILAQLGGREPQPAACDAALVAAVAAQAAAQALAFIDKAPLAGAAANGTLELVLPAWQWRRRTWLPHPACTCRAAAACGREL